MVVVVDATQACVASAGQPRLPPAEKVTVQPDVEVELVKVNVARPAVVPLPVLTGFVVALTPVQPLEAKVAVIGWPEKVGLVTRLPLASWTVMTVVGQSVPAVQPTVAGEPLVDAESLFGEPTMIVVRVAELPAIEVLFVVASHWQVPGVVVAVTVKFAVPAATVVGPAEPAPAILQTVAPLERLTVIWVELSVVIELPLAS